MCAAYEMKVYENALVNTRFVGFEEGKTAEAGKLIEGEYHSTSTSNRVVLTCVRYRELCKDPGSWRHDPEKCYWKWKESLNAVTKHTQLHEKNRQETAYQTK